MSAALRGRKHPDKCGENHPHFKGDDANYSTIHEWMRRHYPRTGVCENCGARRTTHWSNTDHTYRRVREDWRELCVPCHKRHDLDAAKENA